MHEEMMIYVLTSQQIASHHRQASPPSSYLPTHPPLTVLASTLILFVANSTPMVDLESRLNSFLVKRDNRLDFPTPESPIRTTVIDNMMMII